MPIFIDCHPGRGLSDEQLRRLVRAVRREAPALHGACPLDLFITADARACCLHEAPDETSVRQRHARLELPCGRVQRADSLEELSLHSAEAREALRALVANRTDTHWGQTA